MQLKLRLGGGETLAIDVKEDDTFKDLSDKVFNKSGIKLELNHLISNDLPVDLSTNVIQYFAPKLVKESPTQKSPLLCRLCSEPINHDPYFLFEKQPNTLTLADKVNIALPISISTKDILPKQICSSCFKVLNQSFDFVKKVLSAQKVLENIFTIKSKGSAPNDCCPLCQIGALKNVDPNKLTDDSDQNVKKEHIIKKEGVQVSKMGKLDSELTKELYASEDVVEGFWDGNVTNVKSDYYPNLTSVNQSGSTVSYPPLQFHVAEKRRKKTNSEEDDTEWTIDEEYIPISRRGRPKGAKNKAKMIAVVEKSCMICGWLGPENDMLYHALNQHCQPDIGYFPCPLCKTNLANEMILESHLARHSTANRTSILSI